MLLQLVLDRGVFFSNLPPAIPAGVAMALVLAPVDLGDQTV